MASTGVALTLLDDNKHALEDLERLYKKNCASIVTIDTINLTPRDIDIRVVEQNHSTPFDLAIVVIDDAKTSKLQQHESAFIQSYRTQLENNFLKRLAVATSLIDPMMSRKGHSRMLFITVSECTTETHTRNNQLESCKETLWSLTRDLPFMTSQGKGKVHFTNAVIKLPTSGIRSQNMLDAATAVFTALEYGTDYIIYPAMSSMWSWVTRNGGIINNLICNWVQPTTSGKNHID